jgi:hypothetical protein
MNHVFNRRTALRATAGGLVAAAVGVPAAQTRAAAATGDLLWHAVMAGMITWDMTSRMVSRLPTTARYGVPIPLGPIIVQATLPEFVVSNMRQYVLISATGEATLTVTDSRGLTAFPVVALTFPQTPLPETDMDMTLTGTAVITSPSPLPLPRNRGPMTVELDPVALSEWTGWYPDGEVDTGVWVYLELDAAQNRVLTTIDVR